MKKIKIFNDPIYGFITVRSPLVFKLIEHPYFQRLRRISQMGLSYLVYPGAHHTRFHHVLGCTYLMQMAIETLRSKHIEISEKEEEALIVAILLHDMGHGPFSHALEHSFLHKIRHEEVSLRFMEALNTEFNGELDLSIDIFKGVYHRVFMNQLVSSQLDMDRLDYLKRDSFYSGVAEGNINVERLITMLNVKDDKLVLEYKGIYSAEKFIMARRFMYWQVYLHKTGIVAEKVLVKILQRARELTSQGTELRCSQTLKVFLKEDIDREKFDQSKLDMFSRLDDYDVMSALKLWSNHDDSILSYLCNSVVNRKLPKIEMSNEAFAKEYIEDVKSNVRGKLGVKREDLDYFVYDGSVENKAYNPEKEAITILYKNGDQRDIVEASDSESISALSMTVRKYFLCYPKNLL
ncbi:HD domain-containing protein [Lutimonas saemankumensis]|uniref:HD domain-containing protein n=1 Tax=Lutimonas saemankumensis TaxID=483016 RepID=UPI0021D46D9C|nr:HD domain-containing protein [Lutimonas saemankumensis]